MGDFDFSVNKLTYNKLEFFFKSPSCLPWVRFLTWITYWFRVWLLRLRLVRRFYWVFAFTHFSRLDFQIVFLIWFFGLIFGIDKILFLCCTFGEDCIIWKRDLRCFSCFMTFIQNTVCILLTKMKLVWRHFWALWIRMNLNLIWFLQFTIWMITQSLESVLSEFTFTDYWHWIGSL